MCRTIIAMLLATSLPAVAQQATLSICDYESPESRISDLGIQGAFNWSDGPYADGRNRALSANLVADYEGLFSSEAFGRVLNAHAEVLGTNDGWTADLSGAGSLRTFLTSDLFGVGVVGLDASTGSGLGVDLTGGVGTGRFRDVSPLAQAIRIQDALLDIGELQAPAANDTLLDLAQILGEDGPTDDEKVVRLAERLIATELVPSNKIGIRGLLAVEEILQSGNETRLCGRDVQMRLGASAILLPEFSLAATGILLVRFAVVPDPVSQFDSSVQAKFRLARPEEMSIEANASYVRLLPDGWTARTSCRMSIDRMWTQPDATVVSYGASGSLTTKIFGSVGLSLVGNAQYMTGDEAMTLSLAVHLEAELF
jgi:hypothetical protein